MLICYQTNKLRKESLAIVEQANKIIAGYTAQGFNLTLRQLYYQFIARDLLPESWIDPKTGSKNNERSYKRLGDAIANGRLAGLISWEAIVDRTRFLRKSPSWDSPQSIVEACASQFQLDKWDNQPWYVEVLIEKDALLGVVEPICTELQVPYLACRGYPSASEIWQAGHKRFRYKLRQGKQNLVLHLGDHDPSGIDMTRDLEERLCVFAGGDNTVKMKRIALNIDQVRTYAPPPNPTKLTDSRAVDYISKFGEECWELDALEPALVATLIRQEVLLVRDEQQWAADVQRENEAKSQLLRVAEDWDDIQARLADE